MESLVNVKKSREVVCIYIDIDFGSFNFVGLLTLRLMGPIKKIWFIIILFSFIN